jgi:pilus assembly protein Flp/PilA
MYALISELETQPMTRALTAAKAFATNDEGAALVEYGILVALIAVVCFAAIQALGTGIRDKLFGVANGVFP